MIYKNKLRRAWEHKRQVNSTVVSPQNKKLPDDGPYAAEAYFEIGKTLQKMQKKF
jgi:hypothetical protein